MNPSEVQQERRVGWSDQDLVLFALIVRMMEIDPTFERLESVFEKGARLMKRLRSKPERKRKSP